MRLTDQLSTSHCCECWKINIYISFFSPRYTHSISLSMIIAIRLRLSLSLAKCFRSFRSGGATTTFVSFVNELPWILWDGIMEGIQSCLSKRCDDTIDVIILSCVLCFQLLSEWRESSRPTVKFLTEHKTTHYTFCRWAQPDEQSRNIVGC